MSKKTINFHDYNINKLKNPKEASFMLQLAIEDYINDNDEHHFLSILKDIAKAQGNISDIAERAGIGRQNLYKLFSGKQDPRLSTILKLINVLGFSINIKIHKNNGN